MTDGQPLIGITGSKRAGKNTLASLLPDNYAHLAFAGPVRWMVEGINPLIAPNDLEWYDSPSTAQHRPERLCNLIGEHGYDWESLKDSPYSIDSRRWLQVIGTDVARLINPNHWLNIMREMLVTEIVERRNPVVITDVRFPNEAELIRSLNGVIVKVHRSNADEGEFDPLSLHASETEIDQIQPDHVVQNDGTIEDLIADVRIVQGMAIAASRWGRR